MRRITIIQTYIWEEEVPENAEVEDVVAQTMEDDPDYIAVEVIEG